ncbi:MAG: hypothetical protein WBC83_01630 [Minisyncoccia bacterium]
MHHKSSLYMEFGGFSNAVLEYVFRLPYEERGIINSIVCSAEVESENGKLDRIARVNVNFGVGGFRKPHFFYIVAECSSYHAYGEWKVTGRSDLMDGRIRMPESEREITWLEPRPSEVDEDKAKHFDGLVKRNAKLGAAYLIRVK